MYIRICKICFCQDPTNKVEIYCQWVKCGHSGISRAAARGEPFNKFIYFSKLYNFLNRFYQHRAGGYCQVFFYNS